MRMAAFHLSAFPTKSCLDCSKATISFKVTPQSVRLQIQIITPESVQRDITSVFYRAGGVTSLHHSTHVSALLIAMPLETVEGMTEDGAGTENVDPLEETVLGSGHMCPIPSQCKNRTSLASITSEVPSNSNSRTFC